MSLFRSISLLFALSMMAMGGVAILVYAHGIVDPVGLKMADDGDPFGTPPSHASGVIGCIVAAAVFAAGAWLMVRWWAGLPRPQLLTHLFPPSS